MSKSISLRRRDAVVYQVYPRSFQDSNGDGIGDLKGITARLPHIAELGADAVWLSPIFVSPQADFGYDVSDYLNIDPIYGTLDDFDDLVRGAHRLGLQLLLDIVPAHTSVEHPWFREHPDWYIWSPVDGPANNWVSVFGSSAWERDRDTGKWYLHTYYKEQADLNWHNPEVFEAIAGVMRTWIDRGADGFRLDALQVLFKDAQLRNNPTSEGVRADNHHAAVDQQIFTMNRPEIFPTIDRLRAELPEAFLVAEAAVPTSRLSPYLRSVDLAFCFEFLHAPVDAATVRTIIDEAAQLEGIAWVLSNHDFSRLVSRWGKATAKCAALLLLTLPGAAFIYQGDEIGMTDGPGGNVTFDRIGRDRFRHPMQWDASGGFTTGTPWLPMTNPQECNVADQVGDTASMLSFHKRLIDLRRSMAGDFELLPAPGGVVAYRRGNHVIALNLQETPVKVPWTGELILHTETGAEDQTLPANSGIVLLV